MKKNLNEIELEYVTMRYEDPIVYLDFKKNVELGFPEIRELNSCAEKISENRPYFVLSDVRKGVKVTPEGRKLSSNINAAPLNRGSAVLANNEFYRLAVNFFIGYQKPKFPFRVFTDKRKAVAWLLRQSAKATVALALFLEYN